MAIGLGFGKNKQESESEQTQQSLSQLNPFAQFAASALLGGILPEETFLQFAPLLGLPDFSPPNALAPLEEQGVNSQQTAGAGIPRTVEQPQSFTPAPTPQDVLKGVHPPLNGQNITPAPASVPQQSNIIRDLQSGVSGLFPSVSENQQKIAKFRDALGNVRPSFL